MVGAQSGRTLVVIAVAVATAVLWISLGIQEGLEGEIRVLIDRVGANLFYVHQGGDRFDDDDRAALADRPQIAAVAGEGGLSTGFFPGQPYAITRLEVSDNYLEVFQLPLAAGRSFIAQDEAVAILGWEVKEVVFGETDPLGQTFEGATVIGVLSPIPPDDHVRRRLNRLILVPPGIAPRPALLHLQPRNGPYWAMIVRAQYTMGDAQSAVMDAFPEATIRSISDRYGRYFDAERTLNRLLVVSSLGMFLLAGTTVAGLLFLSVIQRGREIGLRRAVGATRPAIVRLFLGIGLKLTAVGGVIGIMLGQTACLALPLFGVTTGLSRLHLLVLPLSIAVGLLSGLYPSRQAARMTPVGALSLRSLASRRSYGIGSGKLVAALTVIIAAGGLFLLVNLVAASQQFLEGLWGEIDEQTLLVGAPRQSIRFPPNLSPQGVAALRELPGVEQAVIAAFSTVRIAGSGLLGLSLCAVGVGYEEFNLLAIDRGRDLSAEELQEGKPVTLIADVLAAELFADDDPIGQTVTADGIDYTVVGVFNAKYIMPILPAWMIAPYRSVGRSALLRYSFWVKTTPEADLQKTTASIVELFQGLHPDRAKVEIIAPAAQLNQWRDFLSDVADRLGMLVGLGLLIGAGAVFNLVSFLLLLRTRELGLRRAVGATKKRIVLLGMKEAFKITIFAGIIGIGLGLIGAGPLLRWFRLPDSVDFSWGWVIVAVTVGIGIFAGGWPAWQASKPSPADTIRSGAQ